ncbi:50S ribosomal protein L24e [Natrinema sp. CBA1119]|uniref:50S ribosomal protein L24e n=1 Tax=Natrinema sp. CBA1119 TaxID=1608465 RepID=UPI000BF7D0B8|nr:50S ribosomal protein L24e [Natrinema sp. CBA1119]PGF17785.1 50S ribosomal protein L24e [Natrinema sp. CBA1119]
MVEKRTCDYTGEEIEPGTGIMYVQRDGTVLHFVDSKAEKNFKLGREPRDLEWTEDGRRGKGPAQEDAPADEEAEQVAVDDDEDPETEAGAVDEPEEDVAAEDDTPETDAEETNADADAEETDAEETETEAEEA